MSESRIVLVTGKGGVGKSTVAASLAIAAARRGLRTIVTEISGRCDIPEMLNVTARAGSESELRPHLYHATIDRENSLEDYLHREAPGPIPARLLARSTMFRLFVDAAPGLADLLTIGKVWDLGQRPRRGRKARGYDLVVLDGPATGQVTGLLTAPRTFAAVARVGPVATQATAIDRTLRDPRMVSIVAVTTGEQMAVSETLTLQRVLRDQLGRELSTVVANRIFPMRFNSRERETLSRESGSAVLAARWFDGRARSQRAQLARLRRGLGHVPLATLPFDFDDRDGIPGELAGRIDRTLL